MAKITFSYRNRHNGELVSQSGTPVELPMGSDTVYAAYVVDNGVNKLVHVGSGKTILKVNVGSVKSPRAWLINMFALRCAGNEIGYASVFRAEETINPVPEGMI